MTCLHSGLVAQSVRATVINSVDCGFKPHLGQRFLFPSVDPIPKLGLMLRGDKLGISKPYIYIVARINLQVRQTKKGFLLFKRG